VKAREAEAVRRDADLGRFVKAREAERFVKSPTSDVL
jgi:hypothetical protein